MKNFVYYSRFNVIILRYSLPIPHMDDFIDSTGDESRLKMLEENSGNWNIEIVESLNDQTEFTSPHGLYLFTWMSFGLNKNPDTIQRVIDVIL